MGSPNFWQDVTSWPKIACVIHTEAGHETSTDAEFENAGAQLSANASVDLAGVWRQFVKWLDAAWANGIADSDSAYFRLPGVIAGVNPNYQTDSIETEDGGDSDGQAVTDVQYAGTVAAFRDAIATAGGTHKFLLPHHLIYSGHSCPGQRWLSPAMGRHGVAMFDLLSQDLGLIGLKTAVDVGDYLQSLA